MPGSINVTSTGAYTELEGEGARVTSAGTYAELEGDGLRVTNAGAYAELRRYGIQITGAGLYLEFMGEDEAGGLTSTEIANTKVAAFNIGLRYFVGGELFTELADLTNFKVTNALPVGWTASGDTITPTSPWLECTWDVIHEGTFQQELTDGKITWRADISGYNYNPVFYSPGKAVCCLRRIETATYDSGWVLWWLGVFDSGSHSDDYRRGQNWSRQVRSIEASLDLLDSPRLVVAGMNMLEDASATASSTLGTPAAEAGNNEFVGTTANVEPDNTVDQRLNTLWISQNTVNVIAETPAATNRALIDEIFYKPYAGFAITNSWWFEIFNNEATNTWDPLAGGTYDDSIGAGTNLYVLNTEGLISCLSFQYPGGDIKRGDQASGITLAPGERGVICADKRIFDEVTGGVSGAKWVVEAKSWGTVAPDADGKPTTTFRSFNLNPDDGWVALAAPYNGQWHATDLVKWSVTGATVVTPPAYVRTGNGEPVDGMWTGVPVNTYSMYAGQGLRRLPTGTDTNTLTDWTIEAWPRPGDKWEANEYEWVQAVAREHASTLGADSAIGATTLTIQEGTTGWLDSGTGILDTEAFTYTGRTATTLTGVGGLTAAHIYGSVMYPTNSAGEMMTGWYTREIVIRRPTGLPTIKRGRVYTSSFANPRTPDDVSWESDYHNPFFTFLNDTGETVLRFAFILVGDVHWTRTVLVVIDEMSDGGRAKINEIELILDNLALGDSGVADLGDTTAGNLIDYLLTNYTDVSAMYTDKTPATWGDVGNLALAIETMPKVLADIARVHGCIIDYRPNGEIHLITNPWWPGGREDSIWLFNFNEDSLRDQWTVSDAPYEITGVALSATGTDGTPLARVVVPPNATGSTVREVTDYTVKSTNVLDLAWSLYWQMRNTQRAEMTVKGIGEWCEPPQRYLFTWHGALVDEVLDAGGEFALSAGGTSALLFSDDDDNAGQWLCESVTYTWGHNRWECRLGTRKYYV